MQSRFAPRRAHGMLAAVLPLAAACAFAQGGNVAGPLPKDFGFEQKLGVQLPLDVPLKDENGKDVKFGDYFQRKPVVFAMVFYRCNGSCLLIRDGIIKTLNSQKFLRTEQDFDVVALSIDHRETPDLAKAKKAYWLKDYKYEGTENGWHFLTGTKENIQRITDQAGFKFTYDEANDRIAHAAGIIVCTPDGKASEYLLGVTYPQKEVRDAIQRAQKYEIGARTQEILWGCLQYDPKTGGMRVKVERLLQITGSATAIGVLIMVIYLSRKYKRAPLSKAEAAMMKLKQESP